MYRKLETAVVIPCYNEEKMITQTIKKLPKYIDHIIAVNDASTDDTIGVLNKLKKQIQNMVREINQIDNWDKVDKVHNILKVNKLCYTDFIEEYTSSPR